jgi:rhodanese-related sulfurtransferase
LAGPNAPTVLDVRAVGERADKRIEPSQHIVLDELVRRASEVPRDERVVIHCAGGYRSSIAASILMQQGFTNVEDLIGGFAAFDARGPSC